MKKEYYTQKAKHYKLIRTAVLVLVCAIFIPLIVANGILITKGALNQRMASGFMNVSASIAETEPSRSIDETLINTIESTTAEESAAITEETIALTSIDGTQCAAETIPSTETITVPQAEPVTTAAATTVKPAATQPATKKPVVTQPGTTKPATTQPVETQPTTNAATPSDTPCIRLNSDEQTMLNLINQERAKAGLPEVKLDSKLSNVAQTKCKELIQLNYFGHQSPVYGSPFNMMAYFGIKYSKAGENLAMNTSVERAHIALMNSDEHRKTILNPDYTYVGIGAYQGVSGKYYTQMFICS
jgi:uncharacterized YkwD family protein